MLQPRSQRRAPLLTILSSSNHSQLKNTTTEANGREGRRGDRAIRRAEKRPLDLIVRREGGFIFYLYLSHEFYVKDKVTL